MLSPQWGYTAPRRSLAAPNLTEFCRTRQGCRCLPAFPLGVPGRPRQQSSHTGEPVCRGSPARPGVRARKLFILKVRWSHAFRRYPSGRTPTPGLREAERTSSGIYFPVLQPYRIQPVGGASRRGRDVGFMSLSSVFGPRSRTIGGVLGLDP